MYDIAELVLDRNNPYASCKNVEIVQNWCTVCLESRSTKLFIEQIQIFFQTSNRFECIQFFVVELEYIIFGFEQMTDIEYQAQFDLSLINAQR